jgi:hypothetical protein
MLLLVNTWSAIRYQPHRLHPLKLSILKESIPENESWCLHARFYAWEPGTTGAPHSLCWLYLRQLMLPSFRGGTTTPTTVPYRLTLWCSMTWPWQCTITNHELPHLPLHRWKGPYAIPLLIGLIPCTPFGTLSFSKVPLGRGCLYIGLYPHL